jgi:hypothetical protein
MYVPLLDRGPADDAGGRRVKLHLLQRQFGELDIGVRFSDFAPRRGCVSGNCISEASWSRQGNDWVAVKNSNKKFNCMPRAAGG